MIGTVTLNPAVDKTLLVPGFAIGRTNRAQVERVDFGGKGINVARAARQLGCAVWACGFMAGFDGADIRGILTAAGIANDFVNVAGKVRTNLKIKDPLAGTETEINEPGFTVEPEHLERLEQMIREKAAQCSVMVFSGSLPPGVPADTYARFIHIAKERGARTILDTAGAALRSGIAARPDLVKPNRAEVEELVGGAVADERQLLRAAGRVLELGAGTAVISLGKDGALAASRDSAWRAWPPAVTAASSIAAGDCMVAVLSHAIAGDLPLPEALRLAVAAGTATASMSGSRVAGRELIGEFLPRVTVEEAAGKAGFHA